MNAIDIINKKRLNESLTYEEIEYMVEGFLSNEVKSFQMSSFLMAICLNGMEDNEVFALTDIMIKSGDILDLSKLGSKIVDKHSTGGVGDKTTLIIAPIVASLGVKIAKMSGRGLGHTGGTIDKLESIEGFKTSLSESNFISQVKDINVAITSQTGNLAPADKKIYGLRDVTGTVESIPLIASSIMSKKIASGADVIVMDIKLGNGALIKTLDDAKRLADLMKKIGKNYRREVVCLITNMDIPLGRTIGNSLEVIEAMQVLRGKGSKDITEISVEISSHLVSLAKGITLDDARKEVEDSIESGLALDKFLELIEAQGGDIENIRKADKEISIKSNKTGFVSKIHTLRLGELARNIGAGRLNLDDKIKYGVGFALNKKVGDYILEDEELIRVYLDDIDINVKDILECFEIKEETEDLKPLIYEVIA